MRVSRADFFCCSLYKSRVRVCRSELNCGGYSYRRGREGCFFFSQREGEGDITILAADLLIAFLLGVLLLGTYHRLEPFISGMLSGQIVPWLLLGCGHLMALIG